MMVQDLNTSHSDGDVTVDSDSGRVEMLGAGERAPKSRKAKTTSKRPAEPVVAMEAGGSSPEEPVGGPPTTKAALVLGKLREPDGVTIAELIDATGWQAHSVRGFLSGTVKRKLALPLVSEINKEGVRRYRVVGGNAPNDGAASKAKTSVATLAGGAK